MALTRIAAFLLLLVAIGGGAALAGAALDPSTATDESASGGHAVPGSMDAAHGNTTSDDVPQGLAAARDGYRLQLVRTQFAHAGRTPLALRILGPEDRPLRSFDVEHTKRLHLIVVRRDMSGFQHLHPAMDADGTWRTVAPLAAAGSYRVFADFSHAGTRRTLAADVEVAGRYAPHPLPAATRTARTVGGLTVTLAAAPAHAVR